MAPKPICKIEGCGKPVSGCGWCNAHWQRWKKHGDPLAGGPAQTPRGEPGRYFRDVVLTYAGDDCLIWPYGRISTGYGNLYFDGRMQLVSRLACEHANGPPPTPDHEAAHSCGRGRDACCNPRHVNWATHTENMADKIGHGTTNRGERGGGGRLTEADVREIRALLGRVPQSEIARRFGISAPSVSDIATGRTWGSLA